MNTKVDEYLQDGCGRCKFYKTPNCKVLNWQKELKLLRQIVLDTELREDYKWSQPCYTFNNKNILLVGAFKDYTFISFFKGFLLKDYEKTLFTTGENSQAIRQFRFTDTKSITEQREAIKTFIHEAIEVEKAGLKVDFKKGTESLPLELEDMFQSDPKLKAAFDALTPGRQRGYILHISGAKQSSTRVSRIKKVMPKIFEGKGFNDR